MSLFAKIFGSETVLNKGASALDHAFFTDQEKAAFFVETLKAYEPFKLAQRLLALAITSVYLFVWVVAAGLMVLGVVMADEKLVEGSRLLGEKNNESLGPGFALVMGFYFAGGMIEGAMAKWAQRARS